MQLSPEQITTGVWFTLPTVNGYLRFVHCTARNLASAKRPRGYSTVRVRPHIRKPDGLEYLDGTSPQRNSTRLLIKPRKDNGNDV